MDYPFEKLHQVRSLREQSARSDLAQGRQRLNQADQEVSSKRMHLERHRLHQAEMQIRLFEGLNRKEVTLHDFENYRGRISDLRTEEKKCQEGLRQAEIQKDSARAEVDRLSVAFQKRCKESAKLREFRKTWSVKAEEEKNWWMEEEMEDMVLNRFARNHTDR